MADDELGFASDHALLVHQSDELNQRRTGAWIADALARGEKVLYWSVIDEPTVAPAAADPGQVEIIDARRCRAETGGEHQAVLELHVALVKQARRQGYQGVAITGDEAALHALTPDPEQLLAHERDLNQLTAEPGIRALCRYDLRTEDRHLLAQLAGVHYHGVEDVHWASEEWINKLVVRGEIDISNVERFAAVLRGATTDSLRIVDLAGVRFLSVAGSAALVRAAELLSEYGEQLVLINVPPIVMRVLSLVDFIPRTRAEVIPAAIPHSPEPGPTQQREAN